jgi:hypothetical protein
MLLALLARSVLGQRTAPDSQPITLTFPFAAHRCSLAQMSLFHFTPGLSPCADPLGCLFAYEPVSQ